MFYRGFLSAMHPCQYEEYIKICKSEKQTVKILTVHTALNAILLEYTSSFEPCHYCACEAKSVPVKI